MSAASLAQRAALNAAFKLLDRGLRSGSLKITTPDGRIHAFSGSERGPDAEMAIRDWRTFAAVFAKSDIGLGESYARGWWDSPDLVAFATLAVANTDSFSRLSSGSALFERLASLKNRIWRRNSISGSKANILAHYDLGNEFYKLWLDDTLSYSSALYDGTHRSLEEAQDAKYARILDQIDPHRGDILEIGCGWGGFLAAAGARDRHVTALTISPEQHSIARMRAPRTSDVHLLDYRKSSGRYGAIVSIEMFEAVGERYWPTYFATLNERLTNTGRAVIQTITIRDDLFETYRRTSDYVRAHVFPGGMLPSLSVFKTEARRAGLTAVDTFAFGNDYARTLVAWLGRFDAEEQNIRRLGFDDAFVRGWRFYFALCAGAFISGRTNVYQVALVRGR